MKRSRLCLSALSVCLALLSAFSVTANAEEIAVDNYNIRQDVYLFANGTQIWESFYSFTPHNETEEKSNDNKSNMRENVWGADDFIHRTVWNVFRNNGFPFELNKKNFVTFDNFYFRMLVDDGNVMQYVESNSELYGDTAEVVLTFADGTTRSYPLDTSKEALGNYDLTFTFTPTQNVTAMAIILDTHVMKHLIQKPDSEARVQITSYMGEFKGDNTHDFLIDIQTEEAGLLSGLLEWVKGIFSKIGEMLTKVTEIGDYIKNLPVNLWNNFENGLKGLFIPSEEGFMQFKTNMSTLLETRLGAVYDVTMGIYDMFDKIRASEATNTIEFPKVCIPVGEGCEFEFGGYDVRVVPEGFEFLATACKLVAGVVATLACVNGLRKKYDDLMEG